MTVRRIWLISALGLGMVPALQGGKGTVSWHTAGARKKSSHANRGGLRNRGSKLGKSMQRKDIKYQKMQQRQPTTRNNRKWYMLIPALCGGVA